MTVKVLLYAYSSGVFSSRKIARKLHEDVAFRVLGAGNFPKHRAVCDFRAPHLEELAALFMQVVRLASECGLVKLGTIAVDGTKVKASASRHKAMSHKYIVASEARLQAQIAALQARTGTSDVAKNNEPELDIPAEIKRREERLNVIQAARVRVEMRRREADAARGRSEGNERVPRDKDGKPKRGGDRYKCDFGVPDKNAQKSFTAPDSRIMKRNGGGFDQSYNGQTAVDAQIIVAAEVVNCAADSGQLGQMLAAVEATADAPAQVVLADAGYRSEAARASYRPHKAIVEAPNGWIKYIMGFRQFSLRGLAKVRAEWKLVCAALNLRRMNLLCSA